MNKVEEVEAVLDGDLLLHLTIQIEKKFGSVVKVTLNGNEIHVDEKQRHKNTYYLHDLGNGYGVALEEYNY